MPLEIGRRHGGHYEALSLTNVGRLVYDGCISILEHLAETGESLLSARAVSRGRCVSRRRVTYKTAWFLAHRIRHAMGEPYSGLLLGSGGGTVEWDETFFGRKKGAKTAQGGNYKHAIFSLVERGGRVCSKHIAGKRFDEVKEPMAVRRKRCVAGYASGSGTWASARI